MARERGAAASVGDGVMKRIPLTKRETELLVFIKGYSAANKNVAPSMNEMREAMGLKSKSSVYQWVLALELKGHIKRAPNSFRGISVVPEDPFEDISTKDLLDELQRRGVTV